MTRTKNARNYTKEEIDFITQNVNKYYVPKLVEMFNEKFNANITIYKLKNFKHRYNLHSNLPKNPLTGKEPTKRYNQTRKQWLDKVKNDIGYEMKRKDGTIYIKVNNKVGATNNYMTKAQYIYTKKYGEIPKGYVLMHKDNNKENNSIDNLTLIKKQDFTYLKASGLISKDNKIIETALILKELKNKIKVKEKSTKSLLKNN